uniref:Uncharacterized protein n=1 Tax=Oryza meridionalis TaxID=40149 RepID=A0A0E0D4J8_9ORYZ
MPRRARRGGAGGRRRRDGCGAEVDEADTEAHAAMDTAQQRGGRGTIWGSGWDFIGEEALDWRSASERQWRFVGNPKSSDGVDAFGRRGRWIGRHELNRECGRASSAGLRWGRGELAAGISGVRALCLQEQGDRWERETNVQEGKRKGGRWEGELAPSVLGRCGRRGAPV